MTFEKDKELVWFRAAVLPQLLTKVQHQCKKESQIRVIDIDLDLIGSKESFMLTTCYRVKIQMKIHCCLLEKRFVLKKTPTIAENVFKSVGFEYLFHNEVVTYDVILPAMKAFIEEQLGPKKSSEYLTIPGYILGEVSPVFGLVVLEDFKPEGWEISEAKYNLSLDHILLAVKYIARFHGIGFALKEKEPASCKKLKNCLKESRFFQGEEHPDYVLQQKIGDRRLKIVAKKYYPEIEEEFLDKMLSLLKDFFKYGLARVQPVEPLATFCHGDYLRNNLAFKYDAEKNPTDVIMFDLQTMRYSHPIIDLVILLSLSTFAEVRHQNFQQIFSTYCETLRETFETFTQQTAPDYLSFISLVKDYTSFLPYGLHIAGFFLLNLVEPLEVNSEEWLKWERTPEEIEQDMLCRGGEIVDRELAHQVYEFYSLCQRYEVDFNKGFEHLS